METVQLTRDCTAVKIPEGTHVDLPAGTECVITQSLGGSYTVQVRSHGGLYRIRGRDADSLGKTVAESESAPSVAKGDDWETVVETALRNCYDPEIPVNIVDLGLVYDQRISDVDDGSKRVDIKMTLTAPGCGMGAAIAADAEDKVRLIDGISDASVEIVWDPPWNPRMISEEGRKKLGL